MFPIMIGLLKKIIMKQNLGSIAKGIVDGTPFISTIKEHVEAKEEGKPFDWVRFTTSVVTIASLMALLSGKIDYELFEKITKLLVN